MISAEGMAQRCERYRPTRTGFQATCPSHDDVNASLVISTTPEGKVLLHCHAGCQTPDVLAALGLTWRDLQPAPTGANGKTAPIGAKPQKREVARYHYVDAQGNLLYDKVRFEPKSFAYQQPNGVWSLRGIETVLYRLPQVLQAPTVYVAEGEKDVHTLESLGLVATTNPGGAGKGKWLPQYSKALRGKDVILLPDNDDPGILHMQAVATALTGIATRVTTVILPALPPHGDVTDWVAAGGTRDAVHALVRAAMVPPSPPPRQLTEPDDDPDDDAPMPYSDYTNAMAFLRDHGMDFRYCSTWKTWMVWTGQYWERDVSGAANRRASTTIKRLARQVEWMEEDQIPALLKHVKSSLNAAKIKTMLEWASWVDGVHILPKDFDTQRWLLNCTNGTIDLRSGTLLPFQRTHFLTNGITTPYLPEATCPLWEATLNRLMDGDQGLITFLQRIFGYTLTGDTSEQCLFLFWGHGANGKSTILGTIRALLGTYGTQADAATFLARTTDAINNDLASMASSRFVGVAEVNEGRRLAESLMKQVTGKDPVKARFLNQEFFEYLPQFKIFIATNHKPLVRGTDIGIWRRIRLVPFTVSIPDDEQDKTLDEKLLAELPGILAWCVRGCLDWQAKGLEAPQQVTDATREYRAEMDVVGRFLDERTFASPRARCVKDRLYRVYTDWCKESGEEALSKTMFGKRILERGIDELRTTTARYWQGIDVAQEDQDARYGRDDPHDPPF